MKIVRELRQEDNAAIAKIIIDVLSEHGFTNEKNGGYDKNNLPWKIQNLFAYFQQIQGVYFVIEETDSQTILGGGGLLPFAPSLVYCKPNAFFSKTNMEKNCALEKFYLLPEVRGTGLALQLLNKLQDIAINRGHCLMYIGTEPSLKRAIRFYEKSGFTCVETRKKNTICLLKKLDNTSRLETEKKSELVLS